MYRSNSTRCTIPSSLSPADLGMLSMNERASSKYATFGLFLAIFFLFLRCKGNNLFRDYETFRYFFAFFSIKVLSNVPYYLKKLLFTRTVPILTMLYRLYATQMGRAMRPIAIETASLMTMKNSMVRQPPMQIMLFMKPDSTDRPQKSAAIE